MPALMTADEYNEARRALQDLTVPPDKAHIAYLSDTVIAECPKALSFLRGREPEEKQRAKREKLPR